MTLLIIQFLCSIYVAEFDRWDHKANITLLNMRASEKAKASPANAFLKEMMEW